MKSCDYWVSAYASYLTKDDKAVDNLLRWIADIQKDAFEAGQAAGLEEAVEIVHDSSQVE